MAVLAPQTREGWGKGTHARIISLMDSVIETHHLNPARVVLTGISMGGAGAWLLGASFPHKFAALAPICGYHNGGAEGIANSLKSTPLYVAHGPNDVVVPHDLSAELVKAVKDKGNLDVVFDQTNGTFPEGAEYMEGHDSWTRVYRSREFWQWVRAKSKSVAN
jgi:predicted peptidase